MIEIYFTRGQHSIYIPVDLIDLVSVELDYYTPEDEEEYIRIFIRFMSTSKYEFNFDVMLSSDDI